MYQKIEQAENVARGHVEVTEIIAYDFDRMEKVIDEYTGIDTGKERKVEKSRGPYFCQTKEQEKIFNRNNSGSRLESFTIQMLESTGKEYIDNPENIKQFNEPELMETRVFTQKEEITAAFNLASKQPENRLSSIEEPKPAEAESTASPTQTLESSEQNWRKLAKKLGVPLNKETGGSRKKEDVLMDIVFQTTVLTS